MAGITTYKEDFAVSYQTQAQLEADNDFQQRNRAAAVQQADFFKSEDQADLVALADAVMRDESGPTWALLRLAAAGPGIADKVDTGDGAIDQALVTDADLLSLTQANWPVVAALYFDQTGVPLT